MLSANHLAYLMEKCIERVPCPNVKIITNLCNFLRSDPDFTPNIPNVVCAFLLFILELQLILEYWCLVLNVFKHYFPSQIAVTTISIMIYIFLQSLQFIYFEHFLDTWSQT